MHQGYDFSNWNGPLPDKVPGDFVYLLANDGGYVNADLQQQVDQCRRQSKPFGLYWFLRPDDNVTGQIALFVGLCRQYAPGLPPAIDNETASARGWVALGTTLITSAEAIKKALGVTYVLHYCNVSFYDALQAGRMPYPVWLADPSAQTAPSRSCLIWQQAPRSVAGLSGLTDPDLFVGAEDYWQIFTNQITPILTEVDDMQWVLNPGEQATFLLPGETGEIALLCDFSPQVVRAMIGHGGDHGGGGAGAAWRAFPGSVPDPTYGWVRGLTYGLPNVAPYVSANGDIVLSVRNTGRPGAPNAWPVTVVVTQTS